MNSNILLRSMCVLALVMSTKEVPIESPAKILEFNHEKANVTSLPDNGTRTGMWRSVSIDDSFRIENADRPNHSRMIKTSTSGYDDDWWYQTTKRPISFKDFPGRIGVASWREIPPGTNVRAAAKASPTAAEVSSKSQQILAGLLHILPFIVIGLSLPSINDFI